MKAFAAGDATEIRDVVDFPKTSDFYATPQEKEPHQGIKIEGDIKNGLAERNLLDVFTPQKFKPATGADLHPWRRAFGAGDKHNIGNPF